MTIRRSNQHGGINVDDINLSDIEVYMLRGRRLQAEAMRASFEAAWRALGRLFTSLSRRLAHHWSNATRRAA